MKKMLSVAALAVCLAVPALGQAAENQASEAQIPETQVPAPIRAQTLPPCEQACCFGEFNAATECSYHSPSYGYRPYSQCYWWWLEGGACSI